MLTTPTCIADSASYFLFLILLSIYLELFYASYNIEIMTRAYGVNNLHRFLNFAVINFYLAIYL